HGDGRKRGSGANALVGLGVAKPSVGGNEHGGAGSPFVGAIRLPGCGFFGGGGLPVVQVTGFRSPLTQPLSRWERGSSPRCWSWGRAEREPRVLLPLHFPALLRQHFQRGDVAQAAHVGLRDRDLVVL